jgi:uncharacterized protein YuzE
MKFEYDRQRDLLYVYFGDEERKAAKTVIVAPGAHADLSSEGSLIGIEVLDASEVLGGRVQFEVSRTGAGDDTSR